MEGRCGDGTSATIYLAPLLDVLRGRSTAQLGLPCAAQREARFFTLGGRTHTAWAGERCKMDSSSSSFCSSSYCSSGVGGSQVAVRDGGVGGGVRADLPLRVGGE